MPGPRQPRPGAEMPSLKWGPRPQIVAVCSGTQWHAVVWPLGPAAEVPSLISLLLAFTFHEAAFEAAQAAGAAEATDELPCPAIRRCCQSPALRARLLKIVASLF